MCERIRESDDQPGARENRIETVDRAHEHCGIFHRDASLGAVRGTSIPATETPFREDPGPIALKRDPRP